MRTTTLLAALLLTVPATSAFSQVCTSQSATQPVKLEAGRTNMVLASPDHNTTDPDGTPRVTEYRGEVFDLATNAMVTNWTIPKSSFVADTVAGCYRTLMPAMAGLLPAAQYYSKVLAIGTAGLPSGFSENSNPFFLPSGAPRSPGNFRVLPVPAP